MVRSLATGILIGAAALVVSAADLRGEDAASALQSLYGGQLKQVSATPDRADDVALAREMIAVARTSDSTPQFQALLCETAYELGAKHPDGYTAAAEAMQLLAEAQEPKRAAAREKWVDILARQSRVGKQEQRDAAGDALIALLLTLGGEKAEKRLYAEAAADYRRALATAHLRKSELTEDIKSRLESAVGRDRIARQLERLQTKLLADANDFAAAEEIVRLYIVEFDDPRSALQYVNRVKDEQLKQRVPRALKSPTELQAGERLDLGEWHKSLADQTTGASKRALLARAREYIQAFLETPEAKDNLPGKKAEVLLRQIDGSLAQLPPQPLRPSTAPAGPSEPQEVFNFRTNMDHAALTGLSNKQSWVAESYAYNGQELATLFQHPSNARAFDAAFEVELPRARSGQEIVLRLGAMVTAETKDGVRFSILVDDKPIWTHTQRSANKLESAEVSLTKLAGRKVIVTLRVDPIGNNSNDHARWVEPVILLVAEEKKTR